MFINRRIALLLLATPLLTSARPSPECKSKPAANGQSSLPPITQYSQCGGQNWTGSTTCVDGFTCVPHDTWSQCLPTSQSPAGGQGGSTAPPSSSGGTTSPPASDGGSTTSPASGSGNAPSSGGSPSSGSTDTSGSSNAPSSGGSPSSGSTDTGTSGSTGSDTSGSSPQKQASPSTLSSAPAATAAPSTSSAAPSSAPSSPAGNGLTLSASFTGYDGCHGGNACGAQSSGYSAAISEEYFGSTYRGPACGTCYQITGVENSNGQAFPGGPKTITVIVDNECPREGNPICAQSNGSLNSQNAQINFDLCSDSGAVAAFFPGGTAGLARGSAVQVPCPAGLGITYNS